MILQYIVDHHPVTVRQVADHAAQFQGVVRTTVLNVMERLRRKGILKRKKVNGVFQYSPRQAEADFLRDLVRDFVDTTLRGSVSPFVAYLAQEARINEQELQELKQLLKELNDRFADKQR